MAEQSLVQMVRKAGIPVDTSSATLPQQRGEVLVSNAGPAVTTPPAAPQPNSENNPSNSQSGSSSHNPFGSYTPDQRFSDLPDFDEDGRFQATVPYYTGGEDELADRIISAQRTRAGLLTNLPAPSGSNPVTAYYNIEKGYNEPYFASLMQEAKDRQAFREATGQDLVMVPSPRPETVPEVPEGVEPISAAARDIIPTLNALEAARLDYQNIAKALQITSATVVQINSPADLQVIISSLAEIENRRRSAGDSIELAASLRELQSQLAQQYTEKAFGDAERGLIVAALRSAREAALLALEDKTRQQIGFVNSALSGMTAGEQEQANLLLQNLYESEPSQARAGGLVYTMYARSQLELDRLGLEFVREVASPGATGDLTTAQEVQRAQVLVAYDQVYRDLVGRANEVRGRIGAPQIQAPGFEAFVALPGVPREESNALLASLFNGSVSPANFKAKAVELLVAARTPQRQDDSSEDVAQSRVAPPSVIPATAVASSSLMTPNYPPPVLPQVVATSLPIPPTLPLDYRDDGAFADHLLPPEVRTEPAGVVSAVVPSRNTGSVILSRHTVTTKQKPSNLTVISQPVVAA
jgi:hypothetical protein